MYKRSAIKGVSLFEGLPTTVLDQLAKIAVEKRYSKGETLFLADSPATGFFSITKGTIKVYRTSPSGKEQIIHIFGPGEAVGEVPMFEGGDFPAQCEAMSACEALFYPRSHFLDIIREDPELALKMMALLSHRLRILVTKIEDLSLKETPARLAAYILLLHSTRDSDTFSLDMPKGQIALYLGTIQETLSRILKRFSDDGLLLLNGKEITLLDKERLEAIANQGR